LVITGWSITCFARRRLAETFRACAVQRDRAGAGRNGGHIHDDHFVAATEHVRQTLKSWRGARA
jgi:hypothetical protein